MPGTIDILLMRIQFFHQLRWTTTTTSFELCPIHPCHLFQIVEASYEPLFQIVEASYEPLSELCPNHPCYLFQIVEASYEPLSEEKFSEKIRSTVQQLVTFLFISTDSLCLIDIQESNKALVCLSDLFINL